MADESGIEELNLSPEMERLAWEARTRITWGDGHEKVSEWLQGSGADSDTAQRILATCMKERAASLRLKGLRDLVFGGILIAAAAGLAIGAIELTKWVRLPVRGLAFLLAVSFFTAAYGLYRVVRGAERLFWGARAKGADSDVNELW